MRRQSRVKGQRSSGRATVSQKHFRAMNDRRKRLCCPFRGEGRGGSTKELLAACGGSDVFLVLVYEAYGLDRPVR